MARKTYRIKMTFTYSNGQKDGILDSTVNAKTHIEEVIAANRNWLSVKGHTETFLLVVDEDGHVFPREEP